MPQLDIRAKQIKEKNEMALLYKDIHKKGSLDQNHISNLILHSPRKHKQLPRNVDNNEKENWMIIILNLPTSELCLII